MLSSRSSLLALAIASALAGATVATASSVTTTSFNTWKSSLTGSASEADFGAISWTNYNTSNGVTLPTLGNNSVGYVVTGPDNDAYQLGGTTYKNFTALAGGSDAGAGINVAMPGGGVNAFLVSVGSTGGTPLTLTLSDGEAFVVSEGLFGISISHPISSFLLTTAAGSQAVLDDLYSGTSALQQDPINTGGSSPATPGDMTPAAEGGTSLMLAGGCLILFGAWRKFGTQVQA
jgi:hypothetical protein